MNKYEGQTDRRLTREYAYFRPMGPHEDDAMNIEEMDEVDVRELLKITDELARRVDPSTKTDTRAV